MATPVPTGITARFAGSWVYLTVPAKSGYSVQVQVHQNGQWEIVRKWASEYPIALYAHGSTTEWRARYTRSGTSGEWRTGRAWLPNGFEEDGEQPPPPPPNPYPDPPAGLFVGETDASAGTARVGWDEPEDTRITHWLVLLEGETQWRTTRGPSYVFHRLSTGITYGWRVKAVIEDDEGVSFGSGAVRGPQFELDEEKPPPPPPVPVPTPEGLRTHCITTSSAIVEWERASTVDGWEVAVGNGPAQFTTSTRHAVRGLQPNTSYTVTVVARAGEAESEPATDTFVTLADEEIEGELPTPTGLHLENPRPGVLQATWDGTVPEFKPGQRTSDAFYVSCDGLETTTQTDRAAAEWTGLPSGEYVVEVYRATGAAVSGIARLAASVKGVRW